ncbi:MAG: protein tyrosine phosphatase family protein [Sulfuricurvum sp.]
MDTNAIYNYIEINSNIAISGQPRKHQFEFLKNSGFIAIINLSGKGTEKFILPDEHIIVELLNMSYHSIPVDFNNPQMNEYKTFLLLMQKYQNDKILIHCAGNYRVSVFFSTYALQYLNWSKDQADALIASIWESDKHYPMNEI